MSLKFGVYGKPGTPEQPGSAGTDLFLRFESRANITTLQEYEDSTAQLTQSCLIISYFTIIPTLEQLSTHAKSQYLGEH